MEKAKYALLTGRRLGTVGALLAAATLLVACGSGADATEGEQGMVHVEIPRSENRAPDPPLPSDYDQTSNNRLSPEEASLDQLWALADSEVGSRVDEIHAEPGPGLTHFAAAIATRCYPLLEESQMDELDDLKLGYDALPGPESLNPAREYFIRATELCM